MIQSIFHQYLSIFAQDISEQLFHSTKDPGSDTDTEIWSFDRAFNEVFRLRLFRYGYSDTPFSRLSKYSRHSSVQELYPKTQQEKFPLNLYWELNNSWNHAVFFCLFCLNQNWLKIQQNLSKAESIWKSVAKTGYVAESGFIACPD